MMMHVWCGKTHDLRLGIYDGIRHTVFVGRTLRRRSSPKESAVSVVVEVLPAALAVALPLKGSAVPTRVESEGAGLP